jgi:hypothetical protein
MCQVAFGAMGYTSSAGEVAVATLKIRLGGMLTSAEAIYAPKFLGACCAYMGRSSRVARDDIAVSGPLALPIFVRAA